MSGNRELFEKKQELKQEWEETFDKTMESSFTAKGIAKFWSDETSAEEAEALLTGAAINDLLCDIIDKVEGIAVVHVGGSDDDEEECTEQYQVYDTVSRQFHDDVFTSIDDAKAHINKVALNSSRKVNELKVVQVYD